MDDENQTSLEIRSAILDYIMSLGLIVAKTVTDFLFSKDNSVS